MTPADRTAFAALLSDVLGFYGQATSPFAMSVWWEACKGFELAAVRSAFTAHATDPDRGHFAPKPADVIRVLRGSSEDAALAAWHEVLAQVRTVGSYGAPQLDAAQRAALDGIGGWSALCRGDEADLPFTQRRFLENYQAQTRNEQRVAIGGAPRMKLS